MDDLTKQSKRLLLTNPKTRNGRNKRAIRLVQCYQKTESYEYINRLWDVLMPYVNSLPATDKGILYGYSVPEILSTAFLSLEKAAKSYKVESNVPFVLWYRRYIQSYIKSNHVIDSRYIGTDTDTMCIIAQDDLDEQDTIDYMISELDSSDTVDSVILAYISTYEKEKTRHMPVIAKEAGISIQELKGISDEVLNRVQDFYY